MTSEAGRLSSGERYEWTNCQTRARCHTEEPSQCRDIGKEIGQGSEGVRFKFKWKRPKVISTIIKYNQIILIT
jgi:hypothetical protein